MTFTSSSPQSADLKRRTIQGGVAKLCGQVAGFTLRLGFLMIMARLLAPEEFGLVAMVTIVTGFYALLTSAGLSSATIQRVSVTHAQISTLFWINMLVGVVLCCLCLATAPALVAFYDEPRLTWVTAALAAGFLVNGAGVQHIATLQRDVRYVTLTVLEVVAQLAGITAGISLALAGSGYWALVAAALVGPAVMTVLAWVTTGWVPGRPHRDPEILSMLRFGIQVTAQAVLGHVAQNLDKVLLGRFRGAEALGVYGRAYQLVTMPMTGLSSAVGWVAFSALSRIQEDQGRFRNYFLKGYRIVLSMVVPILAFATVFAGDLVRVVLGPQWPDASLILQLLAPAALVLTLIEGPTYWLLHSLGLGGRALRITCGLTAVVVLACIAGIPHGATGIATAYSVGLCLWLVPHLALCVRGTAVSLGDLLGTAWSPIMSSAVASLAAWAAVQDITAPLLRLALGGVVMLCGYVAISWLVFGQRDFYLGLAKDLRLVSRAN